MSAEAAAVDRLIRGVRAAFHRLRETADALHAESDVTASMRGVLETLAEGPARTVPSIARLKGVSRQHIQVTVDALVRRGLVAATSNPAHRKSLLIRLTGPGEVLFARLRDREATVLAGLAETLASVEVCAAAEVLEKLCTALDALPLSRPALDERECLD